MLTAAITGPTTVDAMYALVDDVRRRVSGSSRAEIGALTTEAELEAMCGRFDEGRDRLAKATALAAELGFGVLLSASSRRVAGIVELSASEFAAAAKPLLEACEALEQMGDWGHFASVVPYVVDALYPIGRVGDAARLLDLASRYELMDDMDAQIGVRRARAKVLAHQGDYERAEKLAREAVAMADATDHIESNARARCDLAEVLRLTDRVEEASAVLEEAIGLFERKGNVAGARNARAKIDELAAQPPATA
jgi:tetratricopeptide (TPR) repeat protein